jgi:hypothetical protein
MDDDKVRELLGRYRPIGPRSDLRERLLGSMDESPIWPWAAAAAALVAATLGLHIATNRAIQRVAVPERPDSVDALAAAMGGDEDARRAARLIVTEQSILDAWSRRDVNAELEELMNATR